MAKTAAKTSVPKSRTAARTTKADPYSPKVRTMVLLFMLLSFVFLAMAMWKIA